MKETKILILVISLYILPGIILSANAQENYPVPVKTEKMLFYFQRSHNKNTVVYELNTLPNGAINTDKPVNAYWIRYEEGGVKKELSYIQVKAFGLKWKMIDKENKNFVLHFDRFQVLRNIFPHRAVAAGGAPHKNTVQIFKRHGEPVHLWLDRIRNRPHRLAHAQVEGRKLLIGKCVGQAFKRYRVNDT